MYAVIKIKGEIEMNTDSILGKFFTGINYWESKSAINMWKNFDIDTIENDFKLLKDAGITHLRIFPLWSEFQPLCALYGPSNVYEYSFGEDSLPDTPAGRAGVSEAVCEKFHRFCALAEKYDMKLMVALITGHMSFRTYNPPAFDGKAILSDPTVIKWQIRFVKYFVNRFKNEPSIIGWDLGNEPVNLPGRTSNPDTFYVWCSIISDAVKSCDLQHPVISGLNHSSIEKTESNYKTISEMCDIHTMHPSNVFETKSDPLTTMKPILDLPFRCQMGEDIGNIPTFVQEFGSIGYMNCSKSSEADFYRASLYATLAHGCHGTMWWCAFDQGHLEYAPYRWNTIGSDYGFFDKNMNAKPLVAENLQFKRNLSLIPGEVLPKHSTNGTIIVSRDDGTLDYETLRATYMLAKQANLDMNFNYSLDKIQPAPLYIFPSVSGNKSITKERLDEVLDYVKDGSVLYISADAGLLRQIPEITGLNIEYREELNAEKTFELEGERLTIKTSYFYKPEQSEAQIIARDENGDGVFFKNKYGKGFVYFLTLPLEKYLAHKQGAFYKRDIPPYHMVYRHIAKSAGISRVTDSDNPYIRLTEHTIDKDSLYVLAINYNNKFECADLAINGNYDVSVVFGAEYNTHRICLEKNDAVLLKLTKKVG